jgi:hypothetical protein
MAQDWKKELSQVNFRCGLCRAQWDGLPDLVEPAPEQEHHPYRYFSNCTKCGAEHQPQAAWQRALLKAHQYSTGPKTEAGKAAAAANLIGHPTQEEALRTRFNAMKHGMTARTATYFPARPGKYSFCERCDVDHGYCATQPACVKQTEIFMLHHAAFEQRDPKVLSRLHADLQSALTATLQMCIQTVLGEGVAIKTPRVELSREGVPVAITYIDGDGKVQQVYEYKSHPAFKPLTELITRLGLSMTDLGMTVKTSDDQDEKLRGRLGKNEDNREALADFGRRMLEAQTQARELIGQAQQATKNDPVLVEHLAQQGGGA